MGEQKPLPRQSFTYKNKTGSEGVDPKAHVFAGPRSLSESNPDRKLQFQFVIWSEFCCCKLPEEVWWDLVYKVQERRQRKFRASVCQPEKWGVPFNNFHNNEDYVEDPTYLLIRSKNKLCMVKSICWMVLTQALALG